MRARPKGGPRAGHGALGSGEAGPEPAGPGRGPHVPASAPRCAAPPPAASPPSLAHTYGARVGERARAASGGALGAGRVRHRRRWAGRALCAWGGVCGRGGGRGAAAGAPCVGRRGMSRPAQPRECCGGLEPTARADGRYGGPGAAPSRAAASRGPWARAGAERAPCPEPSRGVGRAGWTPSDPTIAASSARIFGTIAPAARLLHPAPLLTCVARKWGASGGVPDEASRGASPPTQLAPVENGDGCPEPHPRGPFAAE